MINKYTNINKIIVNIINKISKYESKKITLAAKYIATSPSK